MDRWRDKVAVVTGASEGIGAATARRLAKDGMKVAALARRVELLNVGWSLVGELPQLAMDRWREKVAVVTGASEGIGTALVRRLAKDGMKVAALARRAELLEKLEHEVNNSGASGSVKGYVCDVGSWSQVDAVFKAIEEDLGAISVLVNNAGVFKPIIPTDMDLENTKIMLDTNLNGVLYCTKAGLAVMKNHSINDGYIINLSSIAAHTVPLRVVGMYAAAKHAITVMSFALRSQLKVENSRIRVTVVSPALVQTAMTSGLIGNLKLGQYMLAEDVADAIAYAIATPTHVNISEMILENVDDFSVPVV